MSSKNSTVPPEQLWQEYQRLNQQHMDTTKRILTLKQEFDRLSQGNWKKIMVKSLRNIRNEIETYQMMHNNLASANKGLAVEIQNYKKELSKLTKQRTQSRANNSVTNKKKGSIAKSRNADPDTIELPPTPKLPLAKVKLSWLDSPIEMKILMFYHSKPHIFGCQFSNLFYSPFNINTRWLVPTKDGTIQTLMNYEKVNLSEVEQKDKDKVEITPNIEEFESSESVFQAAKAKYEIDAKFVQSLSPGDAARAGQARLKMSNGLANKYKKFGGNPFRIENNHWQFSENDKRYSKRDNWHKYKIEIMNYALRLKFQRYYNLIKEYVDSDIPIYFVEHTKNDKQWADGNNGYGTNYLGKLLTVLCWEFRLIFNQKNNMDKDSAEKKENDPSEMDIKWTIDTQSDEFLSWMSVNNIKLIQNGKQFYQENEECEWLK